MEMKRTHVVNQQFLKIKTIVTTLFKFIPFAETDHERSICSFFRSSRSGCRSLIRASENLPLEMEEMSGLYCSSNSTSTHYFPAAQKFSNNIYIFACVVIVICSVSSTMGNTMILFALRKCQSLHPPSKALLCSLALTDLFVGLVVLPLFTAYYLMIVLEIPKYYCVIAVTYGRTSNFIGAVSLETIVTIAIDRVLAFHLRLRYRELMTLRRVVCILVIQWILAAFWTASWFLSLQVSMISGAIGLLSFCLITALCYLSIRRGLRRHVATDASTEEFQ